MATNPVFRSFLFDLYVKYQSDAERKQILKEIILSSQREGSPNWFLLYIHTSQTELGLDFTSPLATFDKFLKGCSVLLEYNIDPSVLVRRILDVVYSSLSTKSS